MAAKKKAKKKGAKKKAAKGGKKAPARKAKAAPAKNGNGAPAKPEAKPKGKEKKPVDLAPLKAKAEEAKKALDKASKEAEALRKQAKDLEAGAKKAYGEALAPYREACRKAGAKCDFAGTRAPNVAPAVRFLVEKVKDGIKVAIKGRPETEELLTDKALAESVNRVAYGYTDKHLGPKEAIGNKGGYVAGCSYVGSLSSSAGESRKAA
jgi:hypothetical protein